jgi:hypothetical protein
MNTPLTYPYEQAKAIESLFVWVKIEFLESYVVNLQEILDMKDDVIKMKSKCEKMVVSYSMIEDA